MSGEEWSGGSSEIDKRIVKIKYWQIQTYCLALYIPSVCQYVKNLNNYILKELFPMFFSMKNIWRNFIQL